MRLKTSAIRTGNLTKKFRRVEALNGLNLEVPAGAYLRAGRPQRCRQNDGNQDSQEYLACDARPR